MATDDSAQGTPPTTQDRTFDDAARKRLWESELFDSMQAHRVNRPVSPLSGDEGQAALALARLIRLARDAAARVVSEDYLRREALGVMIDIKTRAFMEGMNAGMQLMDEAAAAAD